MPDDTAPESRRDRLWDSAAARGVPLLAILATVAVVVVTFLAAKLGYKLREIILLMVVAGFVALLLLVPNRFADRPAIAFCTGFVGAIGFFLYWRGRKVAETGEPRG